MLIHNKHREVYGTGSFVVKLKVVVSSNTVIPRLKKMNNELTGFWDNNETSLIRSVAKVYILPKRKEVVQISVEGLRSKYV